MAKVLSSIEAIINEVREMKNGQYARVEYKTEVKSVASAFKKLGVKVFKHTTATVRIGVDYDHISTVVERQADPTYIKRENPNETYIVKDKISYNSNTGNYHLRVSSVSPLSNATSNTEVQYTLTTVDGQVVTFKSWDEVEEYKAYMQPSYFKSGSNYEVKNINLSNLIRINDMEIALA